MLLKLEKVGLEKGGMTYLANIDLGLDNGINVLLGPTGAGKTSLLRLMAGLEKASQGKISINGIDVTQKGVKDRSVAVVYQQFVNYPSFTIYENIASPLRQGKVKLSSEEIDRRVREAADRMRIGNLLERLPAELSGGQQQRTAIARALVKGAEILLLDEPLVNLDYKLREELRQELRNLFEKSNTLVVYATTEPAEALLLGGQVAIMDQGGVLQAGATLDVYNRPLNARIGEIFSDPPMNLLPCRLVGGEIHLDEMIKASRPSYMNALPDGKYKLGVRANHIRIGDVEKGHFIPVLSQVELAEIGGSQTYLHLRHGDLRFVAEIAGVASYEIGDQILVGFEKGKLYAFDENHRLLGAPEHG